MSESGGAGGSRYQRSTGGLVGAMIITVLAVGVFTVVRGTNTDRQDTPVRSVDYSASVRAAQAEGRLRIWAPPTLPTGWKATSASYTGGRNPAWHLGLLTADGDYVGVEQSRDTPAALVEEFVDADAERGADVTIAGQTWQTWRDAGGDYAVVRSLDVTGAAGESLLVVGSAPAGTVRGLAARLRSNPAGTGE